MKKINVLIYFYFEDYHLNTFKQCFLFLFLNIYYIFKDNLIKLLNTIIIELKKKL